MQTGVSFALRTSLVAHSPGMSPSLRRRGLVPPRLLLLTPTAVPVPVNPYRRQLANTVHLYILVSLSFRSRTTPSETRGLSQETRSIEDFLCVREFPGIPTSGWFSSHPSLWDHSRAPFPCSVPQLSLARTHHDPPDAAAPQLPPAAASGRPRPADHCPPRVPHRAAAPILLLPVPPQQPPSPGSQFSGPRSKERTKMVSILIVLGSQMSLLLNLAPALPAFPQSAVCHV